MRVSLPGFPLTTAVRVVDRVHDHPTYMRALPFPSRTTSFSNDDILVINIANLANSSHTS